MAALTFDNYSNTVTYTVPNASSQIIGGIPIMASNYADYADEIATSLIWQLENFAGTTEPTNKIPGQIWYDTGLNIIKYYTTGLTWQALGSDLTAVETDIIPISDNTLSLGTLALQWKDLYVQNLYVGGVPASGFVGGTLTDLLFLSSSGLPAQNQLAELNLGTHLDANNLATTRQWTESRYVNSGTVSPTTFNGVLTLGHINQVTTPTLNTTRAATIGYVNTTTVAKAGELEGTMTGRLFLDAGQMADTAPPGLAQLKYAATTKDYVDSLAKYDTPVTVATSPYTILSTASYNKRIRVSYASAVGVIQVPDTIPANVAFIDVYTVSDKQITIQPTGATIITVAATGTTYTSGSASFPQGRQCTLIRISSTNWDLIGDFA